MTAVPSIALCGRSCRDLFERFYSTWPSTDQAITDQVPLSDFKTEWNRFDLWANNIAALQDAYLPTSLEYRIREDANAQGVVKKALAYLEESLQLGKLSSS